MLSEHKGDTLLRWVDEFELDEENQSKEEVILSLLKDKDRRNLEKTRDYFR